MLPFSIIYGGVVRIRNFMFDVGKLSSREFDIPIISVGNITVGGTGKTPLTEFIIKQLIDQYQVALLSRGYKRKTKGVVVSNTNSTAIVIGDEPAQINQKFPQCQVVVAEKRVDGVEKIYGLTKVPDVIVMDDAYQHRYVKPGLSILVMDYNRPLWKDFMLPAGELREPMKGKSRADIVFVSKCPANLSQTEQDYITKKLDLLPAQSIFYSSIGYQQPLSLYNDQSSVSQDNLSSFDVLLVAGIGNPKPFYEYIKKMVRSVQTLYFPDHYQYETSDVRKIHNLFDQIISDKKVIITTEKDAVRFKQVLNVSDKIASNIWFLPIEIEILNQQTNRFKDKITTYVRENQNKR